MTAPAISPYAAEKAFIEATAEKFMKEDIAAATPTPPPVPEATTPPAPDPEATPPAKEVVPPSATPTDAETDTDTPEPPDKESDDDDEDVEKTDEELDAEFAAEASKQKIALTVDDLPEDARPVVKKRIKELEAGFTRAMQDARSYRKDEAVFRAEQKFQSENQAEYVADLLLKNPKLGDAVNELLDGLTTPTARQALDVVVKDKRREAMAATETALKAQEVRVARGLELDSYTRTQAMKLGVPMELGVEASVIAHINDVGDITERDIDQIVAQKAREYENHTRAIRREASKKYVEGKIELRKTGGLKVKPGSGNAPAPSGKPTPKNDKEFIDSFTAKM
jgi:hypothetical protein